MNEKIGLLEKIATVVVVFVAISIGAFIVEYNTNNTLLKNISAKKADIARVNRENQKVAENNHAMELATGVDQTVATSNVVYDKLFDWNSWGQYTNNMSFLRQRYASLSDDKVVDVSGMAVGSGESPISTDTIDYYQSTTYGEVVALVTQEKSSPTQTVTTKWQGISHYDGDTFKMTKLTAYMPRS